MHHRNAKKVIAIIVGILFFPILMITAGAQAQGTTPLPTNTSAPTATFTSAPTQTATLIPLVEERLTKLEKAIEKPQKDNWDKAEAISGIITGGLVAVAIAIATLIYNNKQHKADKLLKEQELNLTKLQKEQELSLVKIQKEQEITVAKIQTVQSLIPSLKSDDPREVETAILSITALEFPDLAAKLAELFRTEGAISALNKMSSSADPDVAGAAERSLSAIFKTPLQALVQISRGGVINGIGFFVRKDGYILTTQKAIDVEGDIQVFFGENEFSADIVALIPDDNLVLLRVQGDNFPVVVLQDNVAVEPDSEVYLIGRDPNVGLVITAGRVTGLSRVDGYGRSELISADIMVPRGYGGAPAIGRDGKVIGMVVLMWAIRDQASKVYILPTSSILTFLSETLKSH